MAEQDSFYENNGYMVVKDVLTQEDVQSVLDEVAKIVDARAEQLLREGKIANKYEHEPIETRWAKICEQSEQPTARWGRDVFFNEATYKLFTNSRLLDMCERYLGSPEITLNGDYFIRPKAPFEDKTTVPWHQDSFYYGTPEGDHFPYKILNLWIPLVDVDEHNGCMQVIPKSDQWGLVPYVRTGDKTEPVDNVEEKGEVVTVRMKAGEVLIFNQFTMHRSLPNVSNGIRWSIDNRYTPTTQSFNWHKLGKEGFEQRYTTLKVRSRAHPEQVENFDDWKAKKIVR